MGPLAGIPLEAIVAVLAIPVVVTAILGFAALRHEPPLLFTCQRCGRDFRRRGHLRYPAACPRCHARDWSLAAPLTARAGSRSRARSRR